MAVALAQVFEASITLYHVIELYGNHKVTPKFNHKDEQASTYEFLIHELQTFLEEQRIESIEIHRTGVTGEDQISITAGRPRKNAICIPSSKKELPHTWNSKPTSINTQTSCSRQPTATVALHIFSLDPRPKKSLSMSPNRSLPYALAINSLKKPAPERRNS